MLRLLRFLVTGSWHEHCWETFNRGGVAWNPKDGGGLKYYIYHMRCKTCGNLKFVRDLK